MLKGHGRILDSGIHFPSNLTLVNFAYADDIGLAYIDANKASNRITNVVSKGREEAEMIISVSIMKTQHICKKPLETTEDDIKNQLQKPLSISARNVIDHFQNQTRSVQS